MYNGKYHTERRHNGKPIIIDLAKLSSVLGDRFEVMVMTSSGEELASETHFNIFEAVAAYDRMLTDFPESPAPLTGRYARLRDDLRSALHAGRAAEDENPEDGGTCNFDAPALFLPRWNTEKVQQAAKEAGTGCFMWRCYGSRHAVFGPNSSAQANARTRNAKAMAAALTAAGYDCRMYYQMD